MDAGKWRRGAAVLCLLAVTGCASSGGGSNTSWQRCDRDAECHSGQRCVEHRCTVEDGGPGTDAHDDADAATDAATSDGEAGADVARLEAGPACTGPAGTDLSACSRRSGNWPTDGGSSPPNSLRGTVTDLIPGGFTCGEDEFYVAGWTVRVSDGERVLDLSGLPARRPRLALGQTVEVESQHEYFPFAPPRGVTTVRSAASDLLYWTAAAGSTSELRVPPELTVTDDELVCLGEDSPCGTWEVHALRVSAGSSSEKLRPGETKQVGDYVVKVGASEAQTSTVGPCFDWYVALVSLSAVRGAIAELEAPELCGGSSCTASEYCALPEQGTCLDLDTVGVCSPRPAEVSCEKTCPGVCGCDGNFYCSACAAARQGTPVAPGATACRAIAPACEGFGTSGSGGCSFEWPCKTASVYPVSYAVDCIPVGDAVSCDCAVDGATVRTATIPALPAPNGCTDAVVLDACGFPREIAGRQAH